MATELHFQHLHCWQNARKLAATVYTLDAPLLNKDWSTRDQLRRASLSVMNNIAEGFTRFSSKEKIRFYEIAQSSASEVESMLFLFEDTRYLTNEQITLLRSHVHITKKQTLALVNYLRRKEKESMSV